MIHTIGGLSPTLKRWRSAADEIIASNWLLHRRLKILGSRLSGYIYILTCGEMTEIRVT